MSKLKFLKIRDVKSPERGHQYDAGIDFFIPKFTKDFVETLLEKNPQLFEKETQSSGTLTFISGSSSSSGYVANSDGTASSYDLDEVSKDDEELIKFNPSKGPYFILLPHNRVMIPSGIKVRMENHDRALIGANKSGVATKHGLVYGAHVIDYTYQGEIHISVINTSDQPVKIFQDQKLMQFVETAIFNSNLEIVDVNIKEDFEAATNFWEGFNTTRGEDGFGSTDKKTMKLKPTPF